MFGLFKRKPAPEGPVQFEGTIEIDRPAADVYRLIDWEDPCNAKRQLGYTLGPIAGEPGRYRLVMPELPDNNFDMTVLTAIPGETYKFLTDIQPRIGRLVSDEECYSIEPDGDKRCKLSIRVIATFQRGMSMRQFEQEVARMTVSCQRALIKLKAHAEDGVEAVRGLDKIYYG